MYWFHKASVIYASHCRTIQVGPPGTCRQTLYGAYIWRLVWWVRGGNTRQYHHTTFTCLNHWEASSCFHTICSTLWPYHPRLIDLLLWTMKFEIGVSHSCSLLVPIMVLCHCICFKVWHVMNSEVISDHEWLFELLLTTLNYSGHSPLWWSESIFFVNLCLQSLSKLKRKWETLFFLF